MFVFCDIACLQVVLPSVVSAILADRFSYTEVTKAVRYDMLDAAVHAHDKHGELLKQEAYRSTVMGRLVVLVKKFVPCLFVCLYNPILLGVFVVKVERPAGPRALR